MENRPPRHSLSDPETWVDRYGDLLFRFARLRIRNRSTAEELVQEALLAAFRARDRFAGRSSESTWIVQILKNKIVDHYRKVRREVPVSDLSEEDDLEEELFTRRGHWKGKVESWDASPEDLLARREFLAVLRDCVDGLPERQAEAFTLRTLDDRSTDEVRETLRVTKTNLGVLLHRARLKLRECLKANWFGGEATP